MSTLRLLVWLWLAGAGSSILYYGVATSQARAEPDALTIPALQLPAIVYPAPASEDGWSASAPTTSSAKPSLYPGQELTVDLVLDGPEERRGLPVEYESAADLLAPLVKQILFEGYSKTIDGQKGPSYWSAVPDVAFALVPKSNDEATRALLALAADDLVSKSNQLLVTLEPVTYEIDPKSQVAILRRLPAVHSAQLFGPEYGYVEVVARLTALSPDLVKDMDDVVRCYPNHNANLVLCGRRLPGRTPIGMRPEAAMACVETCAAIRRRQDALRAAQSMLIEEHESWWKQRKEAFEGHWSKTAATLEGSTADAAAVAAEQTKADAAKAKLQSEAEKATTRVELQMDTLRRAAYVECAALWERLPVDVRTQWNSICGDQVLGNTFNRR